METAIYTVQNDSVNIFPRVTIHSFPDEIFILYILYTQVYVRINIENLTRRLAHRFYLDGFDLLTNKS